MKSFNLNISVANILLTLCFVTSSMLCSAQGSGIIRGNDVSARYSAETINSMKNHIEKEIKEEGGTFIKYTVKRGDTMESIAKKYNISVSELKFYNPYLDCYIGVELEIPFHGSANEAKENIVIYENAYINEGIFYFDQKDYKKAIKCFDQIIKSGEAPLFAYYKRGLAWYNRGKYMQAMEDLSFVMKNDISHIYPDAEDFYKWSQESQVRRDSEKSQAWSDFFGMLSSAVAPVVEQISPSGYNSVPVYPTLYPSTGPSTPNLPVISTKGMTNPSPNIMNTMPSSTISTRNYKEEYEEFCRTHKKPNGSDYSFEEYLAIRYPVNNNYIDNSVTFPSGTTTDKDSKSTKLNYYTCGLCHGTGKCQACDGTGIFKDKMFGTGSSGKKCTVCSGTGICPHCHGDKGYYRHY